MHISRKDLKLLFYRLLLLYYFCFYFEALQKDKVHFILLKSDQFKRINSRKQ